MNPMIQVKTVGKLFTAGALAVAELKAAPRIAKASEVLANAIRAAAPRKTGFLANSVQTVGFGFARRVRLNANYAVPQDKGWAPYQTNAGIRKAGRRRRAKVAGPQHRIPGKEFAYRTFDRMTPDLRANYLEQIGKDVVEGLNQ